MPKFKKVLEIPMVDVNVDCIPSVWRPLFPPLYPENFTTRLEAPKVFKRAVARHPKGQIESVFWTDFR